MFSFNPFKGLEKSNVYLCEVDKDIIGAISAEDLSFSLKWNNYSEVSFTMDRTYTNMLLGKVMVHPLYDKVEQTRKVFIENKGYFILQEATIKKEDGKEYKSCVAFSSEYEMTQKYLENFIINKGTEGSIDGVTFYNKEDPEHSLLNLVIEKFPNWKIGTIHDSLKNLERSFDVSRTDVYDFLMNDVSNTFKCVFVFDTINNEISAYPEDSAGEDTDIYISLQNLAKTMKISYNADDIKTVLSVTGADDFSIRDVNLGLPYIMDLSYYHTIDWMGQELYDMYSVYQGLLEDQSEEYTKILTEIYNLYDQKSELNDRIPDSLNSTTWEEYGLNLLKEKEASYKNIQEVQAESGWGNANSEHYKTDYKPNHDMLIAVQKEISVRESEILDVVENINNAFLQLSEISTLCSIENNFTEEQLEKLSMFMREDEYNDSNFIVIESDTDEDILNLQKELLNVGSKELSKLCQPQLTFDADIENIFAIPEFQKIKDKFETGNYIHVEIRDGYVMKVRILEIEASEKDLKDLNVSFGNLTRLMSETDIHADLLAQAASAGKSVASNSSYWQRGADKSTEIQERIENGLINSVTSIKSSDIAGQSVEWDTYGIHLRKIVDGILDSKEGWITNNQILYTSDNFETVKAVFGEYTIEEQNYWGLLAEAVIAGYIEGSTIVGGVIKSSNYEKGNSGSYIDLTDGTFELAGGALTYDGLDLKIANVDALDEKIKEQEKYIKIDPSVPSITLGSTEAAANVTISDESVKITGSNNAIATLESSKFTAPQADFDNLYFGYYMWVHRTANNHLSLKWVGNNN